MSLLSIAKSAMRVVPRLFAAGAAATKSPLLPGVPAIGGVRTAATKATTASSSSSGSGGSCLAALKEENPYLDVVQYQHKNRTWSVQHVDYYSQALAIGLAENGLIPGDVVLSWLPDHFSEQVRSCVFFFSLCANERTRVLACSYELLQKSENVDSISRNKILVPVHTFDV